MSWMYFKNSLSKLALFCCGAMLLGCASSNNPPSIPTVNSTGSSSSAPFSPQLLSASSWSNAGAADQALTAPLSELTSQTCLTCLGLSQPPACTLHAGNTPMSFTVLPSTTWFDVSPSSGTIAANATANISISAIYAGLQPSTNNKGTVVITAPGYADNTQLNVTLSCGITGVPDPNDNSTETCHLSVICPPCTANTGGNTTYSITSVSRTSGSSLYLLATSPNLPPGTRVVISGVEDNSFDGTFVIASAPEANQFVIAQSSSPDATSGPGTAYVPEVVSCPW